MGRPKIYLETTMFSLFHEERTAPFYLEQKALVRRVFELIKSGAYKPYTFPYATREIHNEQNEGKREKMRALVADFGITVLPITEETERLAALYVREKAVALAWAKDAAHIAMAAYNGLEFIVSLNFAHIVRL